MPRHSEKDLLKRLIDDSKKKQMYLHFRDFEKEDILPLVCFPFYSTFTRSCTLLLKWASKEIQKSATVIFETFNTEERRVILACFEGYAYSRTVGAFDFEAFIELIRTRTLLGDLSESIDKPFANQLLTKIKLLDGFQKAALFSWVFAFWESDIYDKDKYADDTDINGKF
jgi:hypothetical protein